MKFRILTRSLLLIVIALFVSACSSGPSGGKIDYKSTKVRSKLEVPPDLSQLPSSRLDSQATTYSGYAAEQAVQQPAGSAAVLPTYKKVKLVREAGERWLVVSDTPKRLWPQLREFVHGLGLAIDRENRVTGVIETNWAENRAGKPSGGFFAGLTRDTGLRDRYRIRMEQGRKVGTTEIYLTHQGLQEVVAAGGGADIVQTVWQRRATDKGLEAEMLRLLMVHLGVEDVKARSAIFAGLGKDRAKLEFDNNDVALIRTNDPFNSAWRRTGNALDRLDVEIDKKDRNKGIYEIAVVDKDKKDKKPGFFSKLMGKEKYEPTKYRVKVTAKTRGTEVQLWNIKRNDPESTPAAKKFMKQLHKELR